MKERKDPHGNVLPVGVLWVKRRGVYSVATKDGSRVAHSIEEANKIKAEFNAYVASNPDFVPRHRTEHSKSVRRKWANGSKGKASYQKWANTTSGKLSIQRKNRVQVAKGNRLKYNQTEKGRATQKRAYKKKVADAGKKLQAHIGTRMSVALRHADVDSLRVTNWTAFKSSEDIAQHFESTFDHSWMTMENYGPYNLNQPRTWNIGHRIPLSMYSTSKEDMLRCWSKENLFAQCSKENNDNRAKMPPKEVLLPLQAVWPLAWMGCMPPSAV